MTDPSQFGPTAGIVAVVLGFLAYMREDAKRRDKRDREIAANIKENTRATVRLSTLLDQRPRRVAHEYKGGSHDR